jgi:glycerophosphoryl diester phosphodiesterase
LNQPPHPFLDYGAPLAFAHRGGGGENPENTHLAFAHAVQLGYRYLETDVHATADGVVAVIHDPSLDRMSDRSGLVGELNWAEVAAARLPGDQQVPRLDELLEQWPDVRFNIDAKDPKVVEPLAGVLQRANALDRVCVTSFSDRRVAALRRLLGPGLCTAMGPRGIAGLRLASLLPDARLGRAAWGPALAAQVPVRSGHVTIVERRFVDAAHQVGVAVHVWTIDDAPTMTRLLDLGVDGIMTDRPTVLKEVLMARGAWVD